MKVFSGGRGAIKTCVYTRTDNDVPFEVLPASFLSFSDYSGHLSLDVPFKKHYTKMQKTTQ